MKKDQEILKRTVSCRPLPKKTQGVTQLRGGKNERDNSFLNADHNLCCKFFHLGSRLRVQKNWSIFNPTNCFYALGNMIQNVHPGSGSWFFTHFGSRIHPGVKKAPDPGSATQTIREENGNDLLPCLSHFCRAFSRAFPVALLPSVFSHSLNRKVKKLF